jgi:hypothetical protein
MNKTYVLNISGGHGHFLQWILDKFCSETLPIDTVPYNFVGASHKKYAQSGKFVFVDDTIEPTDKTFLNNNKNKNVILIKIDDEVLYWERCCMYRYIDHTENRIDIFDEASISDFLTSRGSTFPQHCKDNNISIKDGYRYAFQDISNCGARQRDNERVNHPALKNHNVYYWPIKNFLNLQDFKKALLEVGEKFKFNLDLTGFDEIYNTWCNQNTILQTSDAVKQHLNGDTSVKLDVLQQAYVDAHKS